MESRQASRRGQSPIVTDSTVQLTGPRFVALRKRNPQYCSRSQ